MGKMNKLLVDSNLVYTPGQKFIVFFNELYHQCNGENQQIVNSGMET